MQLTNRNGAQHLKAFVYGYELALSLRWQRVAVESWGQHDAGFFGGNLASFAHTGAVILFHSFFYFPSRACHCSI